MRPRETAFLASSPCRGSRTRLGLSLRDLPSHVSGPGDMSDEPDETDTTTLEQRLRSAEEREHTLDERECESAAREAERTWLVYDEEDVPALVGQTAAVAHPRRIFQQHGMVEADRGGVSRARAASYDGLPLTSNSREMAGRRWARISAHPR